MTNRSEKSLAQRIELIRSGRGFLKSKRGERLFAECWAEHKAEERKLEERFWRIVGLDKQRQD